MITALKKQPAPPPAVILSPEQQLRRWMEQGRREVFTVHTTLTPGMAKILLEANPDNRRVQERAANRSVAAYASAMLRGEWTLNGEPVILSRDGLLNDGQHRCMACVASNKAIPISITFGVSRESRNTVDQGKARSNADVLSIRGENDVNRLAAAIRFVWSYSRKASFSESPSPDQLLTELERHPGLRSAIRKTAPLTKLKVGAPVCGAYYLCHEHAPMQADAFLERVSTGLNISHKNNPEAQLRRRYEEHARGNKTGKLDGYEQAALFVKAFNAYLHHRNIRQLAWKASTEGFPRVGE